MRATFRQLEAVPPAAVVELVEWFVPRSKQIGGRMQWFGKRKQLTSKRARRRSGESSGMAVLVGVPVSCWSIKSNGHRTVNGGFVPGDGRWDRLVAEADARFPALVDRLVDKAVD